MTVLVVAVLVLYLATGNDPLNVAPSGPDRAMFLVTGAVALVLSVLTEMWIIFWRLRPEGPRRSAFVLRAGLTNTFSVIVVAAPTFALLVSPALNRFHGIATMAVAAAWMLLATWLLSARLVVQLRRGLSVEWQHPRASPFLAMMSATIVSTLVAWTVTAVVQGWPSGFHREQAARPASIRELYLRFPPDTLGLVEPVQIVDSSEFTGGAHGLVLTVQDARGKTLCITYVSNTHSRGGDGGLQPKTLYVRADSCDLPRARAIPPGGAEESALYGLLLRWEAAHPESLFASPVPGDPTASMDFSNRKRAYRFLDALHERYL